MHFVSTAASKSSRCRRGASFVAAILAAVPLGPAPRAATPTLRTIQIDGDLSDWAPVLANPLQVTLDGEGSLLPCGWSSDRDCPVSSFSHDLRAFAWTHDSTYLYVLARRHEGGSQEGVVWVHVDRDLDARMGEDDLVLRVRHPAGPGTTTATLFPYRVVLPGGDPIADGDGLADGHDLPGWAGRVPIWHEGLPSGAAPGTDALGGAVVEERVPWAALGLAPGSEMLFHVGSTASADPDDLRRGMADNMGGPGGLAGRVGHDAPVLRPDRVGNVAAGGTVTYVHVLTNGGTRGGIFALRATSTLGSDLAVLADLDDDGTAETQVARDANGDGDFGDAGDSVDPAHDVDADLHPDVPLDRGASRVLALRVTALPGVEDVDTARLAAWLPTDPVATTTTATDVTDVGDVTLRGDRAITTGPGLSSSFPIAACANAQDEVVEIRALSSEGSDVNLFDDPECDGVPNDFVALDRMGDGDWDVVSGSDSDGNRVPDTGLLAAGACRCWVVQVAARVNAPIGTSDTARISAVGLSTAADSEIELVSVVAPRLEMWPDHRAADGEGLVASSGASVFIPHLVRNNGGFPDVANFARTPPVNDAGWTVRIWSDPNADGSIADGAIVTRTAPIPPHGGRTGVVLEVVLPPDLPQGARSTTTLTAHSLDDPRTEIAVVDDVEASALATYADAMFTRPSVRFAPCDIVRVRATGLVPGASAGYELLWRRPSGSVHTHREPLVADASGTLTDELGLWEADPAGTWVLELRAAGEVVATHAFVVGVATTFAAHDVSPILHPLLGSSISVSSLLRNGASGTSLGETRVSTVVLDPTRTLYLESGNPSTFRPWSGWASGESTREAPVPPLAASETHADAFAVPDVTFPVEGVYEVISTWSSCGRVVASARAEIVVGTAEASCSDGADDDGDGTTDCFDAACARDPACFESACSDAVDGDGDMLVDCADPDCARQCPEGSCGDGSDDDFDGAADCRDADCAGRLPCAEVDCGDAADGDGDGLVDCADPECAVACPEVDCTDGRDGDLDGAADCADADCATHLACRETRCADGVDEDSDGALDCADPDCAGVPECGPEGCSDGIDGDGDMLIDCADPDCASDPACTESDCGDGLDDDGDMATDCDDLDCAADPECFESACADGIDGDDDGDIDCDDADCGPLPFCDLDGDGVANVLDCAPMDASASGLPGPVARLDVRKPAPGSTDALLTWSDPPPESGTGTVTDVTTGMLSDLWSLRDLSTATCLAPDAQGTSALDPRRVVDPERAYWYLVQAENACGEGTCGTSSLGVERVLPAACD